MTVLMASDEITGLIARMQEKVRIHEAERAAREQQIETDRQKRLSLLRQVAELLKPVEGMPCQTNYVDGIIAIRLDETHPPRLMVQILDSAGMAYRCLIQFEVERSRQGDLGLCRTWMASSAEINGAAVPLTVERAAVLALREINECLP